MRQLKISNRITNRESTSLEKYLTDISRIHLITPEQEHELAQRIRLGDENALKRMVDANLRFVVSVAKQYVNQGLALPDLINEGNLGLIKAARRFDETKGFKFISYAVWWIRQSILQAITDHSRMVRLPLNKVGSYNKVNEAQINFMQEFEREPSADELAEIMGVDYKEVESAIRNNQRHVSTDAPLSDEDSDSGSLIDMMASDLVESPDTSLMRESLQTEVREGLRALTEREMNIVRDYFGIGLAHPMGLDEIAETYELSRERVRQIKDRAIVRLRKSASRRNWKEYY